MAIADRVTDLVAPLVAPLGLNVYDVELNGGTLRITVDAADGVNLDRLAQASKAISRAFDEENADPMPGKYTLEVSSPGLERRLRTPSHFASAEGEQISVKLGPQVDGPRRISALLQSVQDDHIALLDEQGQLHRIALDDITKANTVFQWGPGPKPGQAGDRTSTSKPGADANPPESERIAPAR